MKKIISLFLAACLMAPVCLMADNKLDKQIAKAVQKERKEKLKELKKEGWQIIGSSTLEVALLKHYKALDSSENAREVVGIATSTKSKNAGIQMASSNAIFTYAQNSGSDLRGRINGELEASGTNADAEFENFYAAYERIVEREIKNEITPTLTLYRPNGDGTFETQSFFVLNEDKAKSATLRAIEEATKQSEAAQKHADLISRHVNAVFQK